MAVKAVPTLRQIIFAKLRNSEMCSSTSRPERSATCETGSAAARKLCVIAPLMSSCSIFLFTILLKAWYQTLVMVPLKPCGGDRITNIHNTRHSNITNTHLFINFKCPVWFFFLSEALALYSTLLDKGTTYVDFCCKHKQQHLKSGMQYIRNTLA